MRRIVVTALLTVGPFLTLLGCASQSLRDCQQAHPAGSPGYEACLAAELQRQSEELDRQNAQQRRSRRE